MAVPVTNGLGNYQGTLAAELNLISMWNLVNQLKVGNAGYAYVVNSQGTLLASKYTTLQGENVGDIQLVDEFVLNPASAPTNGMSIYTGINGTRTICVYAPLGTPNWAVVTELPWQEAYQPVFQVIAGPFALFCSSPFWQVGGRLDRTPAGRAFGGFDQDSQPHCWR